MKNDLLVKVTATILGALLLTCSVLSIRVSDNIKNKIGFADSSYNVVLNNSNSPTLVDGEGTRTDNKGIVWEYHNCSDYSGHITLNADSYFGVSASNYGITGINNLIANFSGNGELWLLKSVDGITWGEDRILESASSVSTANNYRYIRFYNYSGSINVDSVTFGYSCSGISATEDVDSAKASNVIATSSNLTYTAEYSELSPNSIGGEAVSFEKTDTGSTNLTLGFGTTYKVGPVQNAKVEFDMKTSNINYGKYIQLMNNNTSLGSAIYSDKSSAYKCTNISGDWYHIELPITTVISTISGIIVNGEVKDKPHSDVLNKEFNGIKINAGTCIIDNLRLTSSPCELGIFNNPTYKPSVNEFFWLKVAWVGKLYPEQVTMTFSDDTLARRIPITDENLLHGSPFYIQLLGSGTLTVTCTVVSGYNRAVHTVQHTITIN